MFIDMWYNDKIEDVTKIDISFNGLDGNYRGNIFINDKCVGDYVAENSMELEQTFKHLIFNWE